MPSMFVSWEVQVLSIPKYYPARTPLKSATSKKNESASRAYIHELLEQAAGKVA